MALFSARDKFLSAEPPAVLHGFTPKGVSTVFRKLQRQHSLLSRELVARATLSPLSTQGRCHSDSDAGTAPDESDDSDSLCCDKDEVLFYPEELEHEFRRSQTSPIPISPSSKNSAQQRQLQLDLRAQADMIDMMHAVKCYMRQQQHQFSSS